MSALIRQKDSDMKACFKSSAIKVKKIPGSCPRNRSTSARRCFKRLHVISHVETHVCAPL